MAKPASPITTAKNEIGKNRSRRCGADGAAAAVTVSWIDDMALYLGDGSENRQCGSSEVAAHRVEHHRRAACTHADPHHRSEQQRRTPFLDEALVRAARG
jgi:hypothetical protein